MLLSISLSPKTFGAEASTQGSVIGYSEIQGTPDISDIEIASHIYAGDFRLKSLRQSRSMDPKKRRTISWVQCASSKGG